MDDLHQIRKHWSILESLANSREWFNLRSPDVSAWSIGEQVQHVVLSLRAIATQITRALRKPADSEGSGPNRMGKMILDSGIFPRGRAQAPEIVMPQDAVDSEAVCKTLQETRQKWDDLESRSEQIAESTAVVPHDLLGDFTANDWIRFAPIHTNHHLLIIRDIISGADLAIPVFMESPFGSQLEP